MNMRSAFFRQVVLALACVGAALPLRAQDRGLDLNERQLSAGHYYALVIGNNAYQNIKPLKTAVDDAKEVESVLRTRYGFQTRLLLDASRQQIISALNAYRRELDADANLVIYYAGHGVNDKEADKAYWLPVDARLDDNSNWISADDITTNIKVIPAKHVLIVSDSCYSGTLSRAVEPIISEPVMRQRYLQKMLAGRSRTLMASGGNEPVADGGGGNHSVFASALLRGLAQADKAQFTAAELFHNYVEESVAGRASQTPEYSPLRNSGHESGDFVFFKTQTGATDGPPAVKAPGGAPPTATAVEPLAVELSYWDAIKNSSDPEDYKSYLAKYPNGQFADIARRRAAPTRAPANTQPPAATNNASRAAAPPARLQSVRDYFLWLPEQYLVLPAERRAETLASGGTIVDTKNGYISFQQSAADRTAVALFKRADGSYLVAVSRVGGDAGQSATSQLYFLRYADGQWSDVTQATLPVPFDPALKYELPRYGTTITVTNRAGSKVSDLIWANGSFAVKRTR